MWDMFVNTPLDFLDAPSPASSFKDEVKMSLLIRAVSSQPATLAQASPVFSQPKLATRLKPANRPKRAQALATPHTPRRQRTEEPLRKS